jgi:hypothetical protein
MAEPTTERPGIDATMQALLDAYPFKFTADDELLSAAGVPVQLYNSPTLVHGFISFALVVPAAAEATNRGLAALKTALHRG